MMKFFGNNSNCIAFVTDNKEHTDGPTKTNAVQDTANGVKRYCV